MSNDSAWVYVEVGVTATGHQGGFRKAAEYDTLGTSREMKRSIGPIC